MSAQAAELRQLLAVGLIVAAASKTLLSTRLAQASALAGLRWTVTANAGGAPASLEKLLNLEQSLPVRLLPKAAGTSNPEPRLVTSDLAA